MSMFDVFKVAGSAVSAQSQRLNAVASNLANADSAAAPNAAPYKAKQVVFETLQLDTEAKSGTASALGGGSSNAQASHARSRSVVKSPIP